MNIQYPKGVQHDSGYGQAFRLAVLHGLCYRANSGDLKRDLNHAHAIGYWTGRVSAFMQITRLNPFKNFQGSVLAEIDRLMKEYPDTL